MTTESWQAVAVILGITTLVGGLLLHVFLKDQEDQRLNPSPPRAPAAKQTPSGDSGFPFAIIGGLLWAVVMLVVVLTVLRLGWKLFEFAWS